MDIYSAVKESTLHHFNGVIHFYQCFLQEGNSFGQCYVQHNSLTVGWAMVAFFAAYCFVFSVISNNASKVDQLWSVVPVLYSWHFYYHNSLLNPGSPMHLKLFVISMLISLWGGRLTFNFWKKGGYGNLIHHEEDYRWPILRAKMTPLQFLLFNISFIASYQNILLFLIAVPTYIVAQSNNGTMTQTDWLLAGAFLFFFIMETVADEQHYAFQTLKYSLTSEQRAKHPNQEIRDGFFQSGLFRFCRHPNYFAEQSMWVVVYLYSITDFSAPINWTWIGFAQLLLLFQGSMEFGEDITSSKYPAYKDYQQRTSRCIPWFPGTSKKAKKL